MSESDITAEEQEKLQAVKRRLDERKLREDLYQATISLAFLFGLFLGFLAGFFEGKK